MKKIAILDTSVMSDNMGDHIIMDSARLQLQNITREAFVFNMPTHTPVFNQYQQLLKMLFKPQSVPKFDYKFVCGTNLASKNMKRVQNLWNIHKSDLRYINDFIFVGVGTDGLVKCHNNYTKNFYLKALSHRYIHSVRDEKTKLFLEEMGIKSVNTGCVTMWSLTPEHCRDIPKIKSDNVIFTVTDYARNTASDLLMIETLLKNYEKVFCWIQGACDLDYINQLLADDVKNKIQLISPQLNYFDEFLNTYNCDYVGTRLHAGIRAIQKKKRAIIIGVDNRAKDMSDSYNINYLDRNDLNLLDNMINNSIETNVNINKENINLFLNQFYDTF